MKRINLTGKPFGRLVVLSDAGSRWGHSLWKCKCSCGEITKVIASDLQSGKTRSCGCGQGRETHGHTVGGIASPTFRSWHNMVSRCTYPTFPRYKNYGGAGVLVSTRWKNFENFLADLGPRPKGKTLGRILDLGNYEPGNVHWMTMDEQMLARRNKRALLTGELCRSN
jgi:hypothetical protein